MSPLGSYRMQAAFSRIAPKALILLYHRVATQTFDPQLLCVTPQHFAEHMEILRRNYHPCRLANLRRRQPFNAWQPSTVVVTFDDGYADNFQLARPILETYEVPATIFVVSGRVSTLREFWWDALENILLFTPALPARLNLTIEQKIYSWNIKDKVATPAQQWNVLDACPPDTRRQVYLDLMQLLRDLDVETRDAALAELYRWAGLDINAGRANYLSVTADELRALPKNGMVEVGAHTVNHPALSALPLTVQQKEIVESKSALETILDHPVNAFAYPFGERRDYTRDTAGLVRAAGFTCACSNFAGHVTALSDPYQLPRFLVRDWDGETFARQLAQWFQR